MDGWFGVCVLGTLVKCHLSLYLDDDSAKSGTTVHTVFVSK